MPFSGGDPSDHTVPRKIAAASLAFVASTVTALALGETALRLVPRRASPVFDRPTHLVGPARNDVVRHVEPIPPKANRTYRIFVLGDSFTWGTNVMADATYPAHLSWVLNRTSTRPFEVFNYGVSGSCTADQLTLFESLAGHEPDMVVIGYFLNDPDPGRRTPKRVAALMRRLEQPPRWESWLRSHSELARAILFRVWSARLVDEQIRYFRAIHRPEGDIWQRHARELEYLPALARSGGAEVRVVIWPHLGFPLDRNYPFQDIHEQLASTFDSLGVQYLDLLDTFRGVPHERLEAVPQLDPHPNEIAHRMAADAIFAWLRDTTPLVDRAIVPGRLVVNQPVPSVRMRLAPLDVR